MARHRDQLPRLSIPPTLNLQQPVAFDRVQQMFSPALPTSLQHSFHPPFPMNHHPLQTPMQTFFTPQPPPAPSRPTHHPAQASIAQLAAAGIHPPGYAMTPLAGHFPRQSMIIGQGQPFPGQPSAQPFQGRHRKQLSIGGPPKAPLGGPGRNHSPLPVPIANAVAASTTQKPKKIIVNLPKETVFGEDGNVEGRAPWARCPTIVPQEGAGEATSPPEVTTAESFPPDEWRLRVPPTLEVFLPGKIAWEEMKNRAIEEKLEKLGVERGSGSNVPHIHAPHARAASISSPADPALLMFKLNKLQQSQANSSANSASTSPQPPYGLSPSPHQQLPRFVTNRHGHSLSLAQPPTQSLLYSSSASNPFGPNAVLGSDQPPPRLSPGIPPIPENEVQNDIFAPQGRVPLATHSLVPPLSAVRPDSRPDFIRGFGLDIPEEEEPEEEEPLATGGLGEVEGPGVEPQEESFVTNDEDVSREDVGRSTELGEGRDPAEQMTRSSTAIPSRLHSRHVSRLSGALTLASVGGVAVDAESQAGAGGLGSPLRHTGDDTQEDMELDEMIEEWTGSEDMYAENETSDDESIGEWSNPSDEERARQQRLERRLKRRAAQQEVETPRRIPNFPRPPQNTLILPIRRDDDIISNPSEEERMQQQRPSDYLGIESGNYYHHSHPSNSVPRSPRPLPPLPHSRTPSAQISVHDPAQAHSRSGSEHFTYPTSNGHQPRASLSGRRDSLNPFAKPFVFGVPHGSGSWTPQSVESVPAPPGPPVPPNAPLIGHARLPSFGKPLNATAQEFKPGGFNFCLPAGLPQMTLPPVEQSRPLPQIPVTSGQGREKRQRLDSSSAVEEGDSMSSFKFPNESPAKHQHQRRESASSYIVEEGDSMSSFKFPRASTPKTEQRGHSVLNPSAQPFTFKGISAGALSDSKEASKDGGTEELGDDSTAKAETGEPQIEEFTLPSASKPKRAPIPLDFKHPMSNNTVPAGLFKALANGGEERTRRAVRSRLASREIFENSSRQPSLDDIHVPTISRKLSRNRLSDTADDEDRENRQPEDEDVFGSRSVPHSACRSSLPLPLHSAADSSISGLSIPAIDLGGRTEIQQLGQRLESLLEDKFSALSLELSSRVVNGGHTMRLSTDERISEVLSLFRTQLAQAAGGRLDDSGVDARGELDFELIKDVIQHGQAELLSLLKRELGMIIEHQKTHHTRPSMTSEVRQLVEQFSMRTINAVVEAISELSVRLETVERGTPARERDAIVDGVMASLMPSLSSLRTDPVDYDVLTHKLSQAVKPHIGQLIDLASDKRETAGLIVDRLIPLLPSTPSLDADAITHKLTTEIRRVIAPIDAHEIKEQVADLVVERLDSRLAVRDKAFNVEVVSMKVTDGVSAGLSEPIHDIATRLGNVVEQQSASSADLGELALASKVLSEQVSGLSEQLSSVAEPFTMAHHSMAQTLTKESDETTLHIKTAVDGLASSHDTLSQQSSEMLKLQKVAIDRSNAIFDAVQASTSSLQDSLTSLKSSGDSYKMELEELRRGNAELQAQLSKARSAHGQARVEKDLLNERLSDVENDRDKVHSQLKEFQASTASRAADVAAHEARSKKLEEALAQALARLQASDVASQTYQEQIAKLEKANWELTSERQSLKSKVDSLELQVTFASRDKETAGQALSALQKQNDYLTSQQEHWDALRSASQQIETLTTLVGQVDNEEVRELKRIRDRSKVLEGEHTSLQRRFKEQETKIANNEKNTTQLRQSLTQTQQRALEWEKRSKEFEGQLEFTQTKLDQAEQAHAQLDTDHSLVKLQLEEREADDRLSKDRERNLREQVANLEAQVSRLGAELDKVKSLAVSNATPSPYTNGVHESSRANAAYNAAYNGVHVPSRPISRASAAYNNNHSPTVNHHQRVPSQSSTTRSETPPNPNQKSVWDSMHAPRTPDNYGIRVPVPKQYPLLGPTTPKARQAYTSNQFSRMSMPSPTPSVVSVAPSLAATIDADGWYNP